MNMEMKTMLPEERKYTYRQSQQISMQTSFIGYLRADFGSTGKEFFSSWNDFRKDLKTDEFKEEFDDVINSLRENNGVLSGRGAMSKYCYDTPGSSFENDRNEYGIRVDTEKYTYLMRLNPRQGEYNLYCYCYEKKWLDRHMQQAERGIRFIDPHYKELFRIPDGDKIRITLNNGEQLDRECRYIDEYHLEVGNNLYHICEFAQRMEQARNTVIPLRSSLPDKCFSVLEMTDQMIIIERGKMGYVLAGVCVEGKSSREGADLGNEAVGITKAQEAAMVAGSMFGWNTPAADPKNYDENGTPIKPKSRNKDYER